MNQPTKIVIGVIVVILVIWGGYSLMKNPGAAPEAAKTNEPIKLGFIGPLTGDGSSVGTIDKIGAEIAVEEINKAGGVNGRQIQMIYEDGQCNAKAATNAANKLISIDKVVAIVGGLCSTETSAFAPVAMQNKVLVFSYGSSAPSLSKTGKYFFRSYPSDAFQGKFSAEYVYNTLGARKVAVVYHQSEWGTGLREMFVNRFKELGGTIVAEEGAPQEARDYRTILSKVKGADADLIYMPMYPDGTTVALKQAQELGIKVKFFGGDAWDDLKMQKEVSGKGDFLFSAPVTLPPADFQAKVSAKTKGNEMPIGTPNAYDNVKILADAIGKFGTDPDKLQEEIRKIKYDGVSGHIEFDANGDVTSANYVIKKIENGSATVVK